MLNIPDISGIISVDFPDEEGGIPHKKAGIQSTLPILV